MEQGSKDRYFQDVEDDIKKLVPEGIVGRVPFKGTLAEVMYQYVGGLTCQYGLLRCQRHPDLAKSAVCTHHRSRHPRIAPA